MIGNPLRFNNSTKEITNNSDLPLTFNNELRLFTPSATTQLLVDGTGDIVVGGVIFSQSNQGIRKQGSGMLLLSGDNTYLGVTNVDEGVLRISHASALGGLGNGTTIGTTANGHEFNTGVLELSGGVSFGAEPLTLIARNPAGGLAVQELAHLRNASGDNTWNGSIAFNTGGNRYNFESQAGLLTIAGAMNDGNGGGNPFLQLMGAGDGLITADFQFSNRTPRLIKKGTGTWTLDADGVNISQLHVEEGTFALGPAGLLTSSNFFNVHGGAFFDISAVSGPGFTLLSGQELRGDGTVIGDVLTNAGSNVSPGSSIGTLTFEDGLHLDGSLTIELDTGTLADLIDVAGLLDISDAMLVFDELNPIVPGDGPFVFAQYGTLEGVEFASVLGQPDGYEIDYNFNNLNQIALVAPQLQAVPEPAALALWLLAALVALPLASRGRAARQAEDWRWGSLRLRGRPRREVKK